LPVEDVVGKMAGKEDVVNTTQRMIWNVYAGVIGAVTAMVATKLVGKAWEATTGEAPPTPNDPEVPLRRAVIWMLASGVGIGLAQLLMNRFAARQWDRFMTTPLKGGKG
jgi:hypothetical protein